MNSNQDEIIYLKNKVNLLTDCLEKCIIQTQDNSVYPHAITKENSNFQTSKLLKENEDLKRLLTAYETSICWKITAPLRMIKGPWLEKIIHKVFLNKK